MGHIEGMMPRPDTIVLNDDELNEYGPTVGIVELRDAIAKLYNEQYRKGKESKYTADNVCIVPGGRAGTGSASVDCASALTESDHPQA